MASSTPAEAAPAMEAAAETTQPLAVDAAQTHAQTLDQALPLIRANNKTAFFQLLDEQPSLINAVDSEGTASAAHWCALDGNMVMLEDLNRRGARMDCRTEKTGMQPLHYAAKSGFLQVVEFLVVTCGCDPDAADVTGATPLMIACQHNWPRTAFWLAQRSPSCLNKVDRDGDTAMHWAAYKDALACLTILNDFGCSPLMADKYGSNCLHLAVARNCEVTTRWLMQHSDSVALQQAKDNKGRTPLEVANEKGLDLISWLLSDGKLENRGVAVQMFHKNAFASFSNFNYFFNRMSVVGMEKCIELRANMYGIDNKPAKPEEAAAKGGAAPAVPAAAPAAAVAIQAVVAEDADEAAPEEEEAKSAPAAKVVLQPPADLD